MPRHIALVSHISPEEQQALQQAFDVTLHYYHDRRDALAQEGDNIEIVYGNVRPFELSALPNLKWVQATWAGIENICYPEFIQRAPILTNIRGASAVAMSEHVIAGLLHFTRDVPTHLAANAAHEWKRPVQKQVLHSSTIMVLGTGGIGKQLGTTLKAFEVNVIGVNSDGHDVPGFDRCITLSDALPLVPHVDHLVCLLPFTQHTEGLIDSRWFDALPEHGIFVNVSRGKVVNEADLTKALTSGSIRGATLDVTAEEPLPPEDDLWNAPNVLITGHRSWHPGSPVGNSALDVFKQNLEHYLAGNLNDMINVIDFDKGY